MFTSDFVNQLAEAVAAKVQKTSAAPLPWPEVMSISTVARYIDRSEDAVSMLIKKGSLPVTRWLDSKPQIMKSDLDLLIRGARLT
jgi:hypothetical protein